MKNSAVLRRLFNYWPCYFGSGARITKISPDFRRVEVRIPLSIRTRNYVGTTFGGSIYAAVDPIYMIMLIQNLGPEYVVWDKSAAIRFRRPGRSPLIARFELTKQEMADIQDALSLNASVDRKYRIEVLDEAGTLHAEVEKVIYIARKAR